MPADSSPTARAPISTRRIEAFTDGVFSIAATLLVLDLTIEGFTRAKTNDELWNDLLGLQQNLLSFVISFLLLCFLWSVHVRQFEYVERVDRTLTMLNTLRLLGVVLIPFTTSLNSEYSEFLVGRLALPVNFLIVVALGVAQWEYAADPRRGLVDGLSDEARRRSRANGVPGQRLRRHRARPRRGRFGRVHRPVGVSRLPAQRCGAAGGHQLGATGDAR
jgi:uncharacterized membrane protein